MSFELIQMVRHRGRLGASLRETMIALSYAFECNHVENIHVLKMIFDYFNLINLLAIQNSFSLSTIS